MGTRLTKAKIKYFMKDELKAIREYHKHGLHELAKDETEHYHYLQNLLKSA